MCCPEQARIVLARQVEPGSTAINPQEKGGLYQAAARPCPATARPGRPAARSRCRRRRRRRRRRRQSTAATQGPACLTGHRPGAQPTRARRRPASQGPTAAGGRGRPAGPLARPTSPAAAAAGHRRRPRRTGVRPARAHASSLRGSVACPARSHNTPVACASTARHSTALWRPGAQTCCWPYGSNIIGDRPPSCCGQPCCKPGCCCCGIPSPCVAERARYCLACPHSVVRQRAEIAGQKLLPRSQSRHAYARVTHTQARTPSSYANTVHVARLRTCFIHGMP